MQTLFLICAAVGGTVMLAQLALSLLGLGDHGGLHFNGDVGMDVGHDISGHAVADNAADADHGSHGHPAHGSTWFFGIITFQTVVAAVTFFGLAGMAASSAEVHPPLPLMAGVACGAAAMFGVHSLMRLLQRLRSDGTQRIEGSVGRRKGPCTQESRLNNQGPGKVQFTLQDRLVEYDAVTSGEAAPHRNEDFHRQRRWAPTPSPWHRRPQRRRSRSKRISNFRCQISDVHNGFRCQISDVKSQMSTNLSGPCQI